ncbi:MAG: hypothetical protein DWQ02_04130 [Bacteroidetes bacterium]|nr:MAG: hypothetical protein DWQ02_04130 [Bacteroidota bacterium]
MDLETGVCGDANCRIDTVRIFWDKYGFYDRLVLPKGVNLEKAKGENFSKEDYKKLDFILSDRNAGLKDVFKEEIVDTSTGEGIDAISGATILLNTDDYVKGAVWTCYTLWHWVNGDIFEIIRRITGDDLPLADLYSHLQSEELTKKYFGLEELVHRKSIDLQTIQMVIDELAINDYLFSKLSSEYFESASDSLYNNSMAAYFKIGTRQQKVICLNALAQTDHVLFPKLLESMASELHSIKDYQVVDLFLDLLDQTGEITQRELNLLFPLVLEENFLIARRVYWFLQDKPLSDDQRKQIEIFQKNNKGKL